MFLEKGFFLTKVRLSALEECARCNEVIQQDDFKL